MMIDSILARSTRTPVILLQADHGHGRMRRHLAYERNDPERVHERMSPFAAYLLPGVPDDKVGDSITPINLARLVLREYFGAELPPLEDASFWSAEDRPMELVRIPWQADTSGASASDSD
jgi:hypothetical protein